MRVESFQFPLYEICINVDVGKLGYNTNGASPIQVLLNSYNKWGKPNSMLKSMQCFYVECMRMQGPSI